MSIALIEAVPVSPGYFLPSEARLISELQMHFLGRIMTSRTALHIWCGVYHANQHESNAGEDCRDPWENSGSHGNCRPVSPSRKFFSLHFAFNVDEASRGLLRGVKPAYKHRDISRNAKKCSVPSRKEGGYDYSLTCR